MPLYMAASSAVSEMLSKIGEYGCNTRSRPSQAPVNPIDTKARGSRQQLLAKTEPIAAVVNAQPLARIRSL
jgi:hypothetical protein